MSQAAAQAMAVRQRPFKGLAMEGLIARWYARNTGRDVLRFLTKMRGKRRRSRRRRIAPGSLSEPMSDPPVI